MKSKLVRWTMSVCGIILMVIAFLVYPDDPSTGFMLAFSGALSAALGLGFLGE